MYLRFPNCGRTACVHLFDFHGYPLGTSAYGNFTSWYRWGVRNLPKNPYQASEIEAWDIPYYDRTNKTRIQASDCSTTLRVMIRGYIVPESVVLTLLPCPRPCQCYATSAARDEGKP